MEEFDLFEVSWEVCNKVGGIYTVVKSKSEVVHNKLKRRYFLVGPYIPGKSENEFEEKVPPENLKVIIQDLKNQGIICKYGKWLVGKNPQVILIDPHELYNKKDEIKKEIWNKFKIDTLNTSFDDYDKPLIWSYAVGLFLEKYKAEVKNKNVIAHCHEWLSGGVILYASINNVNIKTVFTTHATMLGRTLAGSRDDFYHEIQNFVPDEEAYKYKVHPKHQLEKTCAHIASVFTTVSEITNIEADHFFGKSADVLLPNGLDFSRFPTFDEASIAHRQFRTRMKEFAAYFFMPHYDLDVNNTIFMFTAARYEFHGKGLDTIINALAQLDQKLKKEKSKKNIIMFFFIPQSHKGIHLELLEKKTFFEDIKESIVINQNEVTEKILMNMISKKEFNEKDIFSKVQIQELQKKIKQFKQEGNPLISTHLIDEKNDPMVQLIKKRNLVNLEDNKVKVILYPIYLTGADSLLDLNYYESIIGCHLGVFPSYYEPWGYTPLETMSNGVMAITTDLAGFGRYLNSNFKKNELKGIQVLRRMSVSDEDFTNSLANSFYEFTKLDKKERISRKINASEIAENFDWKELIKNYFKAYDLALKK